MHCRVSGCIANTDQAYSGTPACMQGFGGSPELAAAVFKDCMFRSPPTEIINPWKDKDDQFTDRIKNVHPIMCKDDDRHARYALAMEMIHSRHSKYALVDLVNWLLTKWPELQSEAKR